MRLLNTQSLTLKVFGSELPEYAILSHTWGSDEDEISFLELRQNNHNLLGKSGYQKIISFCEVARQNGYDWAWVDTCCIDKTSSAELSEAINSMFQWYKSADVCYAYLEDVDEGSKIENSRWFTRGWTLQELLAPDSVEFYDQHWNELGTKSDLRDTISAITGIDSDALRNSLKPSYYTVALRMSWAANRTTTREEDLAYSLLGIFEVNMPLLYGEGRKSFQRLQDEIFKTSEDYTLLAWRSRPRMQGDMGRDPTGILAKSAWDYRNDKRSLQAGVWNYNQLEPIDWNPSNPRAEDFQWRGRPSLQFTSLPGDFEPPRITARGLRITLPFIISMSPVDDLQREAHLAFLYCIKQPKGEMVCLVLHENDDINSSGAKGQFYRPLGGTGVHFIAPRSITLQFRTVYLRMKPRDEPLRWLHPGSQTFATVFLTGSIGATRSYNQVITNQGNLLVHLRIGPAHFRLIIGLGFYGKWCDLLPTSNENYADEHELFSRGLFRAMTNGDFQVQQNLRSCLPLACGGTVECVLKHRPRGWLHIHALQDELVIRDSETKFYSVDIQVHSGNIDQRHHVDILGSKWF
ncbi:hypothetical protein JX265_002632 [Neoarthrinium moseri]|uniref:Heterokaryon incompatibility domain-containing protein n=1 Tax=Neoarthrinium moseri TaxID=1658444 RepID=A0A9P9WUT8_9PEZI|nr:hypothetical protein JX266_011007 [Neoarthrinium moseri]KAI1879678.1 hypothetical protein JX265_002632 [Neoarthrinium moseri]